MGPAKTSKQWQRVWSDLRKKTRNALATAAAARHRTGNVTTPPGLSVLEQRIASIINPHEALGRDVPEAEDMEVLTDVELEQMMGPDSIDENEFRSSASPPPPASVYQDDWEVLADSQQGPLGSEIRDSQEDSASWLELVLSDNNIQAGQETPLPTNTTPEPLATNTTPERLSRNFTPERRPRNVPPARHARNVTSEQQLQQQRPSDIRRGANAGGAPWHQRPQNNEDAVSGRRIGDQIAEARNVFADITARQNEIHTNMIEQQLRLEERRLQLEEHKLQVEEKRIQLEERRLTMEDRLGTALINTVMEVFNHYKNK